MKISVIDSSIQQQPQQKTKISGQNASQTSSKTLSKTLVTFSFEAKKDPKTAGKTIAKTAAKTAASVTLANKALWNLVGDEIETKTLTGKMQECVLFRQTSFESYKNVLIAGAGSERNHENIRQIASSIYSTVTAAKIDLVEIHFDELAPSRKDLPLFLRAFIEGLMLTDYKFDELKTKSKKDPKGSDKKELKINLITRYAGDDDIKSAAKEATVLSECVNMSRRLGDLPGNLMTPTILANSVVQSARGTGLKVEIWNKARIKKEKMGGLLGVAEGSHEEPRFIIMKYNGAAKSQKPLVFVGKGLTFDTGGISIKPSASMEEMKYDMCGGANVIGALHAIARLKLKVNAIGVVPATENMPGGRATKPGDVHTARNGKTFEVNNTDAEGRLILADALCYASEQKPELIVDAATLTGAMVIALGNIHTGYFTKDEKLKASIESAAQRSGEWVWHMPLTDHHTKDMKGTFADLSNTSSTRGAGSGTAAAFLEQFVGEGIPWAHFDIAGTGWAVGNRLAYCPKKGASGVMVRTFFEIAQGFAN